MDRFAATALWYVGAGFCAIGLPFAVGVYTFDRTFGGRYDVSSSSLSEAASALVFGAIAGAFTFAPLHRVALRVTKARTLAAAVVLALALELLLFFSLLSMVPTAPFLNGNGGAELWVAIVGATTAAIILQQLPSNHSEVKG